MKVQPRWVGWRWAHDHEEPRYERVFVSIRSGQRVHIDQPSEFVGFEEARAGLGAGGLFGLAFAADDSYVVLTEMSYKNKPEQRRVTQLDSYAELDRLGDNVTVVARATPVGKGGRFRYGKQKRWTIVRGRQFIPLTGNHIAGTPPNIEERGARFDQLCQGHTPIQQAVPGASCARPPVAPSGPTVAIASLNTEVAASVRVQKSTQTIYRYSEEMTNGESLGRVVVFRDPNGILWLADGLHRVEAAQKAGWTDIEAEVLDGDKRDAFLHAAGANLRHGLASTAEDRKKVATLLLRDSEWAAWSDREIGRRCGLDGKTVGKLRVEVSADAPQMEAGASAERPQMRTVTRNGTAYQQRVRVPVESVQEPARGAEERQAAEPEVGGAASPGAADAQHGPTTAVTALPSPTASESRSGSKSPDWANDTLDLDYLVASGLLFRINHEILHPLGIRLEALVGQDGQETIGLKDMRKNPAECVYDEEECEKGKLNWERFMAERESIYISRTR